MNAGGNGGAKDVMEASEDAKVLVQSLLFVKFCDCDLFDEYSWEKRLKVNNYLTTIYAVAI